MRDYRDLPEMRNSLRGLLRCSVHHFINDGFKWSLYPLLPLIAADFGLTYGGAGAINTAYNALLAATSIPFGLLAQRFGEVAVLTMGTVAFCGFFALLAAAWSYPVFLGTAFVAGGGSGAAHPVGSAAASAAAPPEEIGSFIGVFNFAGDVGKAVLPVLAGLAAAWFGWRAALFALGLGGVLAVLGFNRWAGSQTGAAESTADRYSDTQTDICSREAVPDCGLWGMPRLRAFIVLNLVGVFDSLARAGVVVFASFVLGDKGFSAGLTGVMLGLVAAGGSLGKLLCGPLGDIVGKRNTVILTEVLTSLAILAFVRATGLWVFPLLVATGFVLNGTSSVLYSMVPDLVSEDGRSQGFGIYYTVTLAAHALSPLVFGVVVDLIGLYPMYHLMAGSLLLTIPLSFYLRVDEIQPALGNQN